jgi:phosphonate transport system substrate-binding protein
MKNSPFSRVFLLLCAMFTLNFSAQAQAADGKSTLSMLVVPQFPATEIHENWGRVLDGLQHSGLPKIELLFAKDINEFESFFKAGRADLIYCNPYHMVMAKKHQGYRPLIRDDNPLKGLLIARLDKDEDPVHSLSDLNGRTLLFPSPNAFGASLYMRALLTRKEGIQFQTKFVKTHSNVIRGVVRKEGQAGGMVAATLAAEDSNLSNRVKVIYETPPVAAHPIAAHPRVPQPVQAALQSVLLTYLKGNPEFARAVQIPNPVIADYQRDYDPLERLNLEEFVGK